MIRSSALLDGLVVLFEHHWQRAIPLFADAAPLGDNDDLLTMLLTGLTDETIARRLGIGLRTVQRRVRALMDELGADTRFQAGFQAARLGWVPGPGQGWAPDDGALRSILGSSPAITG